MAKMKLTVFNPNLENTPFDLKATIKNVEVALKEELYMVGAWDVLGYATATEFVQDDYYAVVDRLAEHFKTFNTVKSTVNNSLKKEPTMTEKKSTMKKVYSVLFVLVKRNTESLIRACYVYAKSEDEAKQEAFKLLNPNELLDGFAVDICSVNLLGQFVAPVNTDFDTVHFFDPDDKSIQVGLYVNLDGNWSPKFAAALNEFLETQATVAGVLKLMKNSNSTGDSND